MMVCGPEVAAWIYESTGGSVSNYSTGIGLIRDNSLVAGCSYEDWTGANVFLHTRLDRSPGRAFWWAIFDYAFNRLGCERCTAPVSADNDRCLKLIKHLGFKHEATLSKAAKHGLDMQFHVLWKFDCRQLDWKR